MHFQLIGTDARDLRDSRSTNRLARSSPSQQFRGGWMIVGNHDAAGEQLVDDLLVAGLIEEMTDGSRHFPTDVGNVLDRARAGAG